MSLAEHNVNSVALVFQRWVTRNHHHVLYVGSSPGACAYFADYVITICPPRAKLLYVKPPLLWTRKVNRETTWIPP